MTATKKLSEAECLEIMDDFLNKQDEPKVGIFWYDPAEQELFGVSSTGISDLKGATIQKLHKDYWVKTGTWIDDHPEAKELIIEEFDLQNSNVRFELGIHWELGHGYEG